MGGRPDLATSYSIPIPDLRYKVPSLKQNEIDPSLETKPTFTLFWLACGI